VSHLLGEEPVVRSGREQTYTPNKDTGRYWEAGAANVHWLIATDDQIEKGINQVLERVKTPTVIVEGNSFSRFVNPHYFVMVRRGDSEKIKKSAKDSLSRASAIYLSAEGDDQSIVPQPPGSLRDQTLPPVYTRKELPELIAVLRTITGATTLV
jgi:molybdopterin-guanine dinucleotide biosynthesis protein